MLIECNHLTELMARAEPLSPPPGFSSRVMQVIRSKNNARSFARGAPTPLKGPGLFSFRAAPRSSIVRAMLQLIALPRTAVEMAMAFANMALFFAVTCLVVVLRLDFTTAGSGPAFPSIVFMAPPFLASMGLGLLGWHAGRRPHAFARTGAGLATIGVLFGLSVLAGLLFQGRPEPALAAFCLGLSGLAATAFLAFGLGRCKRRTWRRGDLGTDCRP